MRPCRYLDSLLVPLLDFTGTEIPDVHADDETLSNQKNNTC